MQRVEVQNIIDEGLYDPIFYIFGKKVFSNSHAQAIRRENLELKAHGKRVWNLIPQEGFQEKVCVNQADIKIIGGSRGSGKAVSVDSLIVTPFGYRRMGDLKVGDIISDPVTGGTEKVLQIYEHPQKDLYEVTFDDGCTCECCDEHLWRVEDDSFFYQVRPFGEIREMLDAGLRVEIPLCRCLDFKGEGDAKAFDVGVDTIIEQIPIPEKYLWAEKDTRLSFIQGVMTTAAEVSLAEKCAILKCRKKSVADQITFILRSLGAKVIKNKGNVLRIYARDLFIFFGNYNWLVCGGVPPVTSRRMVSYRYVGKKDARCITVDSPNALYMLQDFIVTHNTFISLFGALPYADNPDINMYGFRRLEADVRRGIYKSSKQVFRGFASFADTSFEVKFFGGTGATMKMEHLADLSKVKDRFRGAEMPYIVIEELAEFTRENMNVIFDLIGSNRSTTGLPSQFICTCNPVGKSNTLRLFLDWYIDPETDEAIPSRSGKVRYFCRYGEDISEIAWGDTPEEVYANPNAKNKIHSLSDKPDEEYKNFITSVSFIDGAYGENQILQVTDPKYMNRISSGGGKATVNDIRGIWRDVDDTGSLLSIADMRNFFNNTPQPTGRRVAGGDIGLVSDPTVLWAMDGNHIVDIDCFVGLSSETVIPAIEGFLRRNQIAKEDFTFDTNGIGTWLRMSDKFAKSIRFDNRAAAEDKVEYRTRKAESMGLLVDMIQSGRISIAPEILRRTFRIRKEVHTVEEILMVERLVLKWAQDDKPKDIIKKVDMKQIIGHSPDFIEALIYTVSIATTKHRGCVRKGFENL